jgi:hypothetical protein
MPRNFILPTSGVPFRDRLMAKQKRQSQNVERPGFIAGNLARTRFATAVVTVTNAIKDLARPPIRPNLYWVDAFERAAQREKIRPRNTRVESRTIPGVAGRPHKHTLPEAEVEVLADTILREAMR